MHRRGALHLWPADFESASHEDRSRRKPVPHSRKRLSKESHKMVVVGQRATRMAGDGCKRLSAQHRVQAQRRQPAMLTARIQEQCKFHLNDCGVCRRAETVARTLSEAASSSTPSQGASGRLLPLPRITLPPEIDNPPDRGMAAMTMTNPAGLLGPSSLPSLHVHLMKQESWLVLLHSNGSCGVQKFQGS